MKSSYFNLETWTTVDLMDSIEFVGKKGAIVSRVATHDGFRGLGGATKVLSEVCNDADKEGIYLFLEVVPEYGSPLDYQQLEAWYEKFGFKMTKDWFMQRKPNATKPV